MHPFRCVSARSKWTVEQNSEPGKALSWTTSRSEITQRINENFVAKTKCSSLETNMLCTYSGLDEIDIESLWPEGPASGVNLNQSVDIDSRAPDIPAKYDETVFGKISPYLLAKRVLSKARMFMDRQEYQLILKNLLLTPEALDKRYHPQSGDSKYLEQAELEATKEGIPLYDALHRIHVRDTQIQAMLAMELFCISSESSVESMLDLYFDRMCIWQAVGTEKTIASDFCTLLLNRYYKKRAPQKVKDLVGTSKGTLRTAQYRPRTKIRPRLVKTPGLLRALELQRKKGVIHGFVGNDIPSSGGHTASSPSQPATPAQSPSDSRIGLPASRSISNPVYRQKSLNSTVEISFKATRHRTSVPEIRPPLPEKTQSMFLNPPKSPQRSQRSLTTTSIQATPEKEKHRYMISFEEDDEEIGSTDSD